MSEKYKVSVASEPFSDLSQIKIQCQRCGANYLSGVTFTGNQEVYKMIEVALKEGAESAILWTGNHGCDLGDIVRYREHLERVGKG